jgi:Ran-binding protein 9/10
MVRKSAEFSDNGVSKKSNGHAAEDAPNAMDLDENGSADQMETEDDPDSTTIGQAALLDETVTYGRQLAEEFKGDSRRDVSKTLSEIFALLAYKNPFEVKEVEHLLDRRGRVTVAEELNSAILRE